MPITVSLVIILIVAGVAAGIVTSVAGMASLVSYPVLLTLGLSPVSANVTNTTALIFSGVSSTLSSTKELKRDPHTALRVSLVTLVGGLLGSLLLGLAPAKIFEHVVPFLILFAAILMVITNRRREQHLATPKWLAKGQLFWIFLVGLYIGYFGASAGVIFLAIMQATNAVPFAVNNAIKNLACLGTNILSLFVYAMTTKVYWAMAVIMGIGFFIGGYCGPIIVRHVPTKPLQNIITVGAFFLAGYFFYDIYLK